MNNKIYRAANAYLTAKETVIASRYFKEIIWQELVRFESVTESYFLREAAWVILSSGMKETVVRGKFPAISNAFLHWSSAAEIVAQAEICESRAFESFRHKGKLNAILTIAHAVQEIGFENLMRTIQCNGPETLQRFPYLGPATSLHLAKNLGLGVAKPDRHLMRIAGKSGYNSPADLCNDIASLVGEDIAVIDLVLWRYATLHRNYLSIF